MVISSDNPQFKKNNINSTDTPPEEKKHSSLELNFICVLTYKLSYIYMKSFVWKACWKSDIRRSCQSAAEALTRQDK